MCGCVNKHQRGPCACGCHSWQGETTGAYVLRGGVQLALPLEW